ncbi:hypothetical protein GCM10010439_32030 [Actinocorallia aurantiaca]|uniref:Uncharacterized protein n=1 Tax=Actinocorallia aurantiaca TaxID=46204 RepID=A0ABN3UAZ0_9ACTN
MVGSEGAKGRGRVDRDGVGEALEEGDVGAGVAVGDAVTAGQAQRRQDAVGGGDLVGRGEDAGGVGRLAERQGREAGRHDLAKAVRQEALGEEVRRHRDDDGVLAATGDVGEDLPHAADPRGGGERLGHHGGLQVAPQAAQSGREAPGVERAPGEGVLQQEEVGQAVEAAGYLQPRRGLAQKGAVQVEHVQATHVRMLPGAPPEGNRFFLPDNHAGGREGPAFLVSGGIDFFRESPSLLKTAITNYRVRRHRGSVCAGGGRSSPHRSGQ